MGTFVSEGKSITSIKGIIGEHEEVTPAYLGGGDSAKTRIKELTDLGILYSGEMSQPEAKKAAEKRVEETKKAAAKKTEKELAKKTG